MRRERESQAATTPVDTAEACRLGLSLPDEGRVTVPRKINTLLIAIALASSSLGYSPATQSWYQVLEVKGRVDKQTDLFEIKATKWRVSWQTSGKGMLAIFVRTKDDAPVTSTSVEGSNSDETYIHHAGTFYLKILASQEYVIKVEEWR
jgi:hypothetical protein